MKPTDNRFITDRPAPNRSLVLRGSNVCLYVLRGASQGEALYLDSAAYQTAKAGSGKAFHTRVDRIGFQRSAPQNNIVITAYVPAGEFCFETVSYVPRGNATLVSLDLLLALLNSKLVDWYFSIGSTNSKVNEYQFDISIPHISRGGDRRRCEGCSKAHRAKRQRSGSG